MPRVPYEAAVARQQIAVAIVRAAAVICLLAGLARVAQWLIEGAASNNLGDFGTYAWHVAEGSLLLLSGAAGAVWSRGISRLLLGGAAVDLCPGCGYQLIEDNDRCPECGLVFATAMAPPDRLSAHDVLVRRRHLLRAMIRLAILYLLVVTVWQFGTGAAWIAASFALPDHYEELRAAYLVSYAASLAVGLGLAGLVRLAERRLILWLTPVAPERDGPPSAA